MTRWLEAHPRVADLLGTVMFLGVLLAPAIIGGAGS